MSDDERDWTPDLGRFTQAADDAFTVGRVFGQAYEHQGTLVIPVARVLGAAGTGAGGGSGTGSGSGTGTGTGRGSGGGTGHGSGRGSFSSLRRRLGGSVQAGPEQAAEGAPTELTTRDDTGHEPAHPGGETEAQAEAKGDLQGEVRGETHGDARGGAGVGGGAYGLRVRPVGVVVVENGSTRWLPVFDLNRTVLGGQLVAGVAAVALAWAVGRRRR